MDRLVVVGATHYKHLNSYINMFDEKIVFKLKISELDLVENEIENLPEDCEALTRLSTLNLANNKINVIPRNLFFFFNGINKEGVGADICHFLTKHIIQRN